MGSAVDDAKKLGRWMVTPPQRNPIASAWKYPIGFFFKLLGVAGTILGILSIFLVIFIIITVIGSGTGQYWATQAADYASEVPLVGGIFRNIYAWYPAIKNPEELVVLQQELRWKSTIDKNVGNDHLGLKITNFYAIQNVYDLVIGDEYYDGEVNALAYIDVESLMEESIVSFECGEKKGKIIGEADPPGPIEISDLTTNSFVVECIYQGEDFELDKPLTTYTLKFKANYISNSLAYLSIYTMEHDTLQTLLDQYNQDRSIIFGIVGNKDSQLDEETGFVGSTYTAGPVKLNLKAVYNQPFTEKGPSNNKDYYKIYLNIGRNVNWEGVLKEIKNVYFYTYEGVELNEGEYFEYIEDDEDGFMKYRLGESYLEELNSRCFDEEEGVFDIDCWKGSAIEVPVEIGIYDVSSDLGKTYIKAEVEYLYQAYETDVISFAKVG